MVTFDGAFTDNDLKTTLHSFGRDVFFMQVGAMDGVTFDPIHELVSMLGWHGILLEPIPDMHEKLVHNYAGAEGLTFLNLAIADYDGEIEMTRIDPAAYEEGHIFHAVLGISTIMPDRGIIGGVAGISSDAQAVLDRFRRTITVPCRTLKTLMKEQNVSRIDLLVVDTEGADWMVTRQLDLDIYRPRAVYIEYAHLSNYERVACAMHFRNHGYRIFIDKDRSANFLALLPNA